jgi:hypothetical protein
LAGQLVQSRGEWTLALLLLVGLIVAVEVSFRIGRRSRSGTVDSLGSPTGTLLGASLALLGLLLGFTFSMAVTRFDGRKRLVLDESDALGTAHLRAALLPEADRGKTAELLRQYLDVRISYYDAEADAERIREFTRRGREMQRQLWSLAVAAAEKDAQSVPIGLYTESLNRVIELDARRLNALENAVPENILALVGLVAIVSAAVVGYECGKTRQRHVFSTTALTVLITLVVLVILDLDRPRRGLVHAGRASMLRLRESLRTDVP